MAEKTGRPFAVLNAKQRNIICGILALVIVAVFLFPLYWLLCMSFKTDVESFGRVVSYFPHTFTVEPWLRNLEDKDFLISLKNSFIIALCSMTVSLVLGVPTAYGMGRYRVRGGRFFLLTFLVTQMLPASLMLTPMYLIFSRLKLLNTYFSPALAIASGSVPFIVITLRPYFRSIPASLDDAARIDGCGVFRSFLQIMIPAIKVGTVTVMTISFLHGWNDLAYSMTFNVKPEMRPLTANIYKFTNKYGTKWNCIMAYGCILVIPVVLTFVFLQKYIVSGMTAGSVKE